MTLWSAFPDRLNADQELPDKLSGWKTAPIIYNNVREPMLLGVIFPRQAQAH